MTRTKDNQKSKKNIKKLIHRIGISNSLIHTQRKDHMQTLRENGPLQDKARGLGRDQPCQHLGSAFSHQ
jgi:hypothetical protein